MTKTSIEWTDETWNPVTGCDKVSPGCDHCYAEGIANRFAGTPQFPNGFAVTPHPERLTHPLRWKKPRRVFVNSMSDLFHDQIPDEYIARVFAVMGLASQHTFQILTKRHGRMRSLLSSDWWRDHLLPEVIHEMADGTDYTVHYPLPNVWLGVSTEDQRWADIRIPALLDTPAAVRFVSAEPLLGPIELRGAWIPGKPGPLTTDDMVGMLRWDDRTGIDWVIVGGESGPKARPMELHWAQELRDQCNASGVAFLFKQWGEWAPDYAASDAVLGHPMRRVGKKPAGRELDGRTWDQYPGGAE